MTIEGDIIAARFSKAVAILAPLHEFEQLLFEPLRGGEEAGRCGHRIGTLIIATSLIQLANGFFGTLVSLRVAIEDFGPTMSGLVLSSYFAGFTLAALCCVEGITSSASAISAPMLPLRGTG